MYRAVTVAVLRAGVDLQDGLKVAAVAEQVELTAPGGPPY